MLSVELFEPKLLPTKRSQPLLGPYYWARASCYTPTRAPTQPRPTSTGAWAHRSNNIATLPWRAVFADAPLQKLFEEGLNQNLGLHIADTRIQRAQANLAQSRA